MEIGERIRSIRESKGMTQKELAESLNISNSLMNHFEQRPPNSFSVLYS